MKKHIYLALFILTLVFVACDNSPRTSSGTNDGVVIEEYTPLDELIDEAQEALPMDAGMGLTITDISLQGNYVVFYVDCDEDIIPIDYIRMGKGVSKEMIKAMISSGAMEEFIEECVAERKGIAYKYIGNSSGETATIKISYNELSDL